MRTLKIAVGLSLFVGLSALIGSGARGAETPAAAALEMKLSPAKEKSVQVRWQAVPHATQYELSYGTDEQANNLGTLNRKKSPFTLKNLKPGFIYYLKGRAWSGDTPPAWGSVVSFSTQIPQMTNLAVDEVLDSTAELVWGDDLKDLPRLRYQIAYGLNRKSREFTTLETQQNRILLKSLEPNKTYYVKIRARNAVAKGPWSRLVSLDTLPYSPGQAPDRLEVKQDGEWIRATWRQVPRVDGYELGFSREPAFKERESVKAGSNRARLQVAPNTRFYFKVRSLIQGRTSYWSNGVDLLTRPGRPQKLESVRQAVDQFQVTWQELPESKELSVYEIEWRPGVNGAAATTTLTAVASYTLYELAASKRYTVRVRSHNQRGPGPWSNSHAFTTLPATVSRVKAQLLPQNRARISWSGVSRSSSYELSYGTDIEAQNRGLLETRGTQTLLKDLIPGATYNVKVRPILEDHLPGRWSEMIAFDTQAAPEFVTGLRMVKLEGDQAIMTWDPVAGAEQYQLELLLQTEMPPGKITSHTRLPARLSGLQANRTYQVKARAKNRGGFGAWSEAVQLTTLPSRSPRDLEVSGVQSREVVINWGSLPGIKGVRYDVRYAPGRKDWTMITGLEMPTVNLTELAPEQNYRVQVRGQNNSGAGPWSGEKSFRTPTAPPGAAPKGLRASEVTDISAVITWQRQAGVLGYRLNVGTNNDATNRLEKQLTATEFLLRGLMPETTYYAKVNSRNRSGDGPSSETIIITTRPSPPMLAPTGVGFIDVSHDSLTLNWNVRREAISYEVSLGTHPKAEGTQPFETVLTPPYMFRALELNTTYWVKVRMVNRGGGGPWSRVLSTTTLPE